MEANHKLKQEFSEKRVDKTDGFVYGGVEQKTQDILTVKDYRKITKDFDNTNDQIIKRIKFLEIMCRNIIVQEIKNLQKDE